MPRRQPVASFHQDARVSILARLGRSDVVSIASLHPCTLRARARTFTHQRRRVHTPLSDLVLFAGGHAYIQHIHVRVPPRVLSDILSSNTDKPDGARPARAHSPFFRAFSRPRGVSFKDRACFSRHLNLHRRLPVPLPARPLVRPSVRPRPPSSPHLRGASSRRREPFEK